MSKHSSPPVPAFDRRFFNGASRVTRIGNGEIGGKGAGLALVHSKILPRIGGDDFPDVTIDVPTLTVLTTEVFDRFMRENRLYPVALSDQPDDRIAHAFQKANLPADLVGDLRALAAAVRSPLAIRSSSLLEDAMDHPFAGVYITKMIPSNEIGTDARFRRLVQAIKLVYASTFFAAAKSYMRSIGQDLTSEKMAVVIQEVVGQRAGDRFYPCVSGVARSFNYYPSGSARPQEGVISLVLGLGKTVVDGGRTWSFSPALPKAPPPFNDIGELLKNTQTSFWAVHMGAPPIPDPIRETECLVEASLADAEADGTLKYLVSTYDPASDRLNPGLGGAGGRALTFAPLLCSPYFRFNDLLRRLLAEAEQALGTEVEIEFAVNLDRRQALPARVGFLQVRPMRVVDEAVEVAVTEMSGAETLLASEIVLGNDQRRDISDIVYLKPEVFDPASTPLMALDLETINRSLIDAGRCYLLIGFGRWGTSDHWLGVPVAWGQISNARVIVEATLPGVRPDLSQGSHFFHNLLGFRILYLSVEHDGPYTIDWQWLAQQQAVTETSFVRHVRVDQPLDIRVDGIRRRGVVRHQGFPLP